MLRAAGLRWVGLWARTQASGKGLDAALIECYTMRLSGATLAQLVERLIRNQQVVGSNPTGGSMVLKDFLPRGTPTCGTPCGTGERGPPNRRKERTCHASPLHQHASPPVDLGSQSAIRGGATGRKPAS